MLLPQSYLCNGVEWSKDKTQAAESEVETTAGVWQQSVFTCSAADSFQHTPKILTLTHRSTQNYFNRIKTTFHYHLLVLNKARHADDGYKRVDLERHRLLIKLDPVNKR